MFTEGKYNYLWKSPEEEKNWIKISSKKAALYTLQIYFWYVLLTSTVTMESARHRLQRGCLHWPQFLLQWFIKITWICWIPWIFVPFRENAIGSSQFNSWHGKLDSQLKFYHVVSAFLMTKTSGTFCILLRQASFWKKLGRRKLMLESSVLVRGNRFNSVCLCVVLPGNIALLPDWVTALIRVIAMKWVESRQTDRR